MNQNITTDFELFRNYPNPFNPITSIKYQVSCQSGSLTNMSFVVLKVYDILGKEVETLVNEYQKAGTYETQFPGNQFTNNQLSSGIYFYSLFVNGEKIDTKKLMMLK
jgi:hypothetical protein